MIMSAQSSLTTRRSTTAAETNVSLDNTPHPSVKHCADTVNARYMHGRPEHELVPSRYALKVGAIDVMVVSDGVLSLPGAMLGHNVDPAVRAAWLEDMFVPPDGGRRRRLSLGTGALGVLIACWEGKP
jgi:hypothetical protein